MEIGKEIFEKKKELLARDIFKKEDNGPTNIEISLFISILLSIPIITVILFYDLWFNQIRNDALFNLLVLSVGIFFIISYYISKKQEERFELFKSKLSDEQLLLKIENIEKYKVKIGDQVIYKNGFKFEESGQKFTLEKISGDKEFILLKGDNFLFKEVTVDDFLSENYCL